MQAKKDLSLSSVVGSSSIATKGRAGGKKDIAEKKEDNEAGPHNLKPGTRVLCVYRDGTKRSASVLERRPILNDDGTPSGLYRYYVHWLDFNRRMDSWINPDNIEYDPIGEAEEKERRFHDSDKQHSGITSVHGHEGKAHGHSTHSEGNAGIGTTEQVDESGTVFRGRVRDGTMEINFVEPEHSNDGMNEDAIREHEDVTKMKNVNVVEIGMHRMETWYFSPLPKEYWPHDFIDTLLFCEFCLRFFRTKEELYHHSRKCVLRHPPGDEIYRGIDGIGMWEIDGAKEKQYCQNLSYLAKMFLDHKTLYYDVDLFMFYVMTELDENGFHIVGYFSKEKYSDVGYNLACILALPCHQRKGYGRFLIQFSYALSQVEQKVGHPEKPLSDLGLISYQSYWSWAILEVLHNSTEDSLSILDIMIRTSIRYEDVLSTLQDLKLLRYLQGTVVLDLRPAKREFIASEFARHQAKPGPRVDPTRIIWVPYRTPLPPNTKKDKFLISSLFEGGD